MQKIRNKITLPTISILTLFILILIISFNYILKDTYINIIKREMGEKINFINHVINKNPGQYTGRIEKKFSDNIKHLSNIINLRITVIDSNGMVIADSDFDPKLIDNHKFRSEIDAAIKNKNGSSIRYSNTLNIDILYLAKNFDRYVIRIAEPLNELEEIQGRTKKTILLTAFFILITAAIIIIIISRKISTPISVTRDFAEEFSKGNFSGRIQNYSDDEIGILQKALNRMADRTIEKMELLTLEKHKLQVTIESISDGIAVISGNKHIIIANKAFMSLLNINVDPVNKNFFEVIRGSHLNARIETSLVRGEKAEFQEKFPSDKFYDIYIIPIKEEKGIQGILIIVHDITEKKKIEQIKTDLIGNLSHELKTPIAILKGYLETIESNPDDSALRLNFISKALANIDRQNSIINDMLKLNMMETITDIDLEKINLKNIIVNCVEILNTKAVMKKINVKLDIDSLDHEFDGNKFLAEEMFFNIILNAINYTNHDGEIKISSFTKDKKIIIQISDSGIGIPEDSLGRIFERFYRVDKSRSRATGGTGLGLSIVKHAAEILKWKIDVASNSSGTDFFIEID